MSELTPTYDFEQNPAAFLNALERNEAIEITEGTWDYFLNVLPPVYMSREMVIDGARRRVAFGFAEGCEPITAFWREKRHDGIHLFCQRTQEVNHA